MPPVNDDFIGATDLGGDIGSLTFSNVGATTETGEPDNAEGHSVWFTWTPSVTGAAFVSTASTPLPVWDSYLAVFTGTTLGTLVEVANDDDGDLQPGASGSFGTSKVAWAATAGTAYYIQVTAWDDVSGSVERSDAVLAWAVYAPALTSFTPAGGPVGTTVDVHGHGLLDVTGVDIGGVAQSYSVFTDEHMQITVAAGTTTDYIVAHTGSSGDLVSATQFVVGALPTITGVTPSPVVATEAVVITGTNFADTTSVTVGGVGASFVVDSGTQITATVPAAAVSGESITVTSDVGTGFSSAITVYYPGPWHRPADQWAPWTDGTGQVLIWQATWNDGDPQPGFPTTADAPNATLPFVAGGGQVPGWRVWRVNDASGTGFNYSGWETEVVEWIVGVNFDNDLSFSLPPIRPSIAEQTAPDVADFETEVPGGGVERGYGFGAYGAPLGDVQIALDVVPFADSLGATERVGTPVSASPLDSDDVNAAELRAIRIEASDYTWSGPQPNPTQWLTDARLRTLVELAAKPVADGPLEPASSLPSEAWEALHHWGTADPVVLSMTLADLDDGTVVGGFALAFAVSLFVDGAGATLPDPGSGVGSRPLVGKGAGVAGGAPGATGRLYYRPPRYRLLYLSPHLRPAALSGEHGRVEQFFDHPTFTTAKLGGVATQVQGSRGVRSLGCGLVGLLQNDWTLRSGKSMTVGWRGPDQVWRRAEKVPDLYDQGVAKLGYELGLVIASVSSGSSSWLRCYVGGNEDLLRSGIVFEANGEGGHLRLYRRDSVTIGVAVARPGDGDTVRVVTDFLAATATVYYNGSVVGVLDFSGESWYTADASGL